MNPARQADARYTLARFQELAPLVEQALLITGVGNTAAAALGEDALGVARRIAAVRAAANGLPALVQGGQLRVPA